VADKRRAELQRQLDHRTFAWEDWVEVRSGTTWKQAIDNLYRKRVVNGRTGQNTWEISYMGRLRQVPMTETVTPEGIQAALIKYDRDTASYKELFYLLRDIAKLIAIQFPEVPVPTYGTKVAAPDVPDDEEIERVLLAVDPETRWHLGMMAAYGLRNHETASCVFLDDSHRVVVTAETKTGSRVVTPCPREWVELFNLRDEMRVSTNSDRVDNVSQWLHTRRKKFGIPFKPYALRHAYAGRLWRVGGARLDIFTAARLMGHTVKVHEGRYRAWISPHTVAERAEQALYPEQKIKGKGQPPHQG
jgi:integrase